MKNILRALLFAALACAASAAYQPDLYRVRTIVLPGIPIATSGSPTDRGNVTLPADITSYIVQNVYVLATSASGTLAAATVDVRTASAGGGSSVLTAATLLTGLTATDTVQSIAVAALASKQTATTLYLRQTINSANAGTVTLYVQILVLAN